MPRFTAASQIKVGVIGYGGAFNMGRGHLREMQEAGMTPTAVCEIDPERLKVAKNDFPGIETYPTLEAMLEQSDVNLITLITPHNTHAELALQCLRAGRHVVCEKPLAITTDECDAMIAEAEKRNLLLSTYHNRHWDGCILEARRQIEAGAIGSIVRIEAHMGAHSPPRDWWRASRSISGGILYDWGVHLLEYSFQLITAGMTEVSGHAHTGYWAAESSWGDDSNEDEAFAVVRFNSGQWLTLCITSIDANPKRGQLEITGTKGSYIFEGRTWELIRKDGDRTISTRGTNPRSEWLAYYTNIADHLTTDEPLVITPEWARRPIHVLDLAGQSARAGRAMPTRYE